MVLLCFLYSFDIALNSQDWCRQVTLVGEETAECIEPQVKRIYIVLYILKKWLLDLQVPRIQ